MINKRVIWNALVLAVGCLLVGSAVHSAWVTPRTMTGTWSSLIAVPPNDVLGNTEIFYLPELDTFSFGGTSVTSSSGTVMPIFVDGAPGGFYLAAVGIGQGNWIYRNEQFVMTQWRFLSDTATGEPLGYLKIISEWTLPSHMYANGLYQVEMLHMDMATPYLSGGAPVVIGGSFEMWRLPIGRLP